MLKLKNRLVRQPAKRNAVSRLSNKSNIRIRTAFLFFAFFFVFPLFAAGADIVFSDLDLSSDDRLLFRAASSGGHYVNDTLFAGTLSVFNSAVISSGVQQLTVFPEKMDLLENGAVLQIRNSFGSVRLPLSGGLPMPIPGLPSFSGGNAASVGRVEEMAPSGNGRWLLYLDPVSPAFGNLVMIDVYSGAKTSIAPELERPETVFPATWSPDSRFFIYERAGKLYYYTIGSSLMPEEENVRLIGEGTVNSVFWGRSGDFYYLSGSTLYRVRGAELFARVLYSGFLEIGSAVEEIPFEFDPRFDRFWIAPDGSSLLVSKGKRSLFYYPFGTGANFSEIPLPYLLLPRSCSSLDMLWSQKGTVTVLVSVPGRGRTELKVWRLLTRDGGMVFEPLHPPETAAMSFQNAALSPDGKLVVFWGEGGIVLYDYESWMLLEVLSVRHGINCVWSGNEELITGDTYRIERFTLAPDNVSGRTETALGGVYGTAVLRRDLVCLSRAVQFAFDERTGNYLARSGDAWYTTDGRIPWTAVDFPVVRAASLVSSRYRVYLENQGAGYFSNLPMIRNISSTGTFPLFPPVSNPVPRAGAMEVALCFDLYDDDQGLPEILDALNRLGIRATFFLNGEFMRRHPEAVLEIALSGHEVASMFYAAVNFSDAPYIAEADFISRGLARNEDEYFRLTGKELALLWHPPWYYTSRDITAAAERAGYLTIGRDIDPLDWLSREDERILGIPPGSPSGMVNFIIEELEPFSVIPVRIGRLSGGRDDYLFNHINVLLDALLRESCSLTTVSEIIKRRN